ncbi:membrane protein [Ralstonia solanacearum]|uniref:SulP family inorganic anion transporter n=1 Tax=Ralstonia solanacearum TaxID=305 RepID=UPI0007D86BBB|nr:SulP family inorganic anion transporter [Ralstonia solanacearum]OAI58473.1 membrane protein [Ralstonia solanacearum]
MQTQTQPASVPRDMLAGTIVFLVALPLCLGIANASGVDPLAGLMSGMIGGLVVALLSGSQLSVSGPAAGLVVIVVDGIAKLGGFSAFLMAVLLSGVLQFAFGMLRAGRFAAYVPSSVIKGMLAAIGLLLIIKQVPLAFGFARGDAAAAAVGALVTPFGTVSPAAMAVTALSVAVLTGWETRALRRFLLVRALPAPLVVVALGIGVTLLLDAVAPGFAAPVEHRVGLPSLASFGALFDALQSPSLDALTNPDVWQLAVALAIVASLETLLSLEAVEQIDPKKRTAPADRELKAQGIGNMMAGAFGALPITSVIVRSSANVQAGAQSRWSAVMHGALLLASVFTLTSIVNLIPLACLATILIFTGFKLAKPSLFVSVARQGRERFAPFMVTIVGVLLTDLLIGILMGIALSIALAIRANLRRSIVMARHHDHVLLSFRKDVSFMSKVPLKRCLAQVPDYTTLIIDASRADYIDPDVRELVERFIEDAPSRGILIERHHFDPVAPQPAQASKPSKLRFSRCATR